MSAYTRLRTKAQDRALAQLERALLACQRAGIRVIGMGDTLIAQDQRDLDGVDGQFGALASPDRRTGIQDHGAYVDSGGF